MNGTIIFEAGVNILFTNDVDDDDVNDDDD